MIAPERPQERLLIDLVAELPAGSLLCNTVGRAQFAATYARRHSEIEAVCWFLDLYHNQQCQSVHSPLVPNLRLVCSADPPEGPFDLVAWAFSRQGDGELLRELLQTGHERLPIGGRLIASIDNREDQWLHKQLRNLFAKVTRRTYPQGSVYLATKTTPLKKHKTYAAEFAFRDGERLIHVRTRPGVFNHRELDGGARALIKLMEITPAMHVLDLGCGCGAVGIAAALRAADVRIQAIDSNPRAIEATAWSAERNEIADRVGATLDCDGRSVATAAFDLVLANPPYYSDFRIARLFNQIAARSLKPRGRLLVVTKAPEAHVEQLASAFAEVRAQAVGQYVVVSAQKS